MAAALFNCVKVAQKLGGSNSLMMIQAARNYASWNKDFKPAEFPQSEKERLAAAKKYNMLPEEYKPYADEGMSYGDYPELGHSLGIEAKDSYYPYDFPEHKRNLHEIVHADIDMYGEDRYSQPDVPRFTNMQYWGTFIIVMVSLTSLYYWLDDKKMYRPVACKQYPGQGKVHYTFETVE